MRNGKWLCCVCRGRQDFVVEKWGKESSLWLGILKADLYVVVAVKGECHVMVVNCWVFM